MTSLRLIAYAPNGARLGPLPTPQDVSGSFPKNDIGAVSLNYPPGAPRSDLLGQPLEVAVEVSHDGGQTWSEPPNGRFLYLRDGRDPIKTADSYAIEAPAYGKRLEKALIGFGSLTSEGKREFSAKTPGHILRTLILEAQARGALEGMSVTWTDTQDSAGTPWPTTTSFSYDPGTNLLAVLESLTEPGLVDWRTNARALQLYVADHPSGMGADRTTGAAPVVLRFGRDLTEAPFRRTWEGLADTALVLGDNGTNVTRTNLAAAKPWGRQETFVTASGVTDTGTLTTIADGNLAMTQEERIERTFGLAFAASPFLPFRDYQPGEWVLAASDGGQAPERLRVEQITLTRGNDGQAAGNVVLGDRFHDADVRQQRRLDKLTQGATQGGSGSTPGSSPGGNDILAPAKVQGLAVTSDAYVENDGRVRSQVSATWTPVTTNADGTVASDVDHYEVERRRLSAPATAWTRIADVTGAAWNGSPYNPGEDWEWRVRAVDRVFNRGLYSDPVAVTTSADVEPPAKPSAPTAISRLGTAAIGWDGLNSVGAAMARDFRYVAVHLDTVDNFVPTAATKRDELAGAGQTLIGPLNYGMSYYARLVPYDSSGNAGEPSDTVLVTVAPLVDVTNFPDDAMEQLYARTGHFINVTADMIEANAVTTSKIAAGAITADRLSVGTSQVSVVLNGGMEEDDPDPGRAALGFPRNWDVAWQGGGLAAQDYDTATPIAGARSWRLTFPDTHDATWYNVKRDPAGNRVWLPVSGGEKWFVRAKFRASRAVAGKKVRLRFHVSTNASDPLAIFTAETVWLEAASADYATGVTTLEGVATVPAGFTRAAVGLGYDAPLDGGGDIQLVMDAVEAWPAATDASITEVGAGKLRTGVIQADQRVVSGSLTGARSELNASGFYSYNGAGTETFRAAAGTVVVTGTINAAGGNFTGEVTISNTASLTIVDGGQIRNWGTTQYALIQSGAMRVGTRNSSTGALIFPYMIMRPDGIQVFRSATINGTLSFDANNDFTLSSPRDILTVSGGQTIIRSIGGAITLNGTGGNGIVQVKCDDKFQVYDNLAGLTAEFNANGTWYYVRHPTTASGANVHMTAAGGMYRSTSSERYKTDIEDLPLADPLAILRARPVRYHGKAELEAWERGEEHAEKPVWVPGFTAEQLHDAGLGAFVLYDDQGRPDAISYDRLVAAVVPALRRIAERVDALEAVGHGNVVATAKPTTTSPAKGTPKK